MWARLDDGLLDHRKVLEAARLLGKDGRALAIGFYTASLLYASKHLTDGRIAPAVVDELRISRAGVRALVAVGLWEEIEDGYYRIHDYHDFNFTAAEINKRRAADRERKRINGATGGRHSRGAQR